MKALLLLATVTADDAMLLLFTVAKASLLRWLTTVVMQLSCLTTAVAAAATGAMLAAGVGGLGRMGLGVSVLEMRRERRLPATHKHHVITLTHTHERIGIT